MNDCKHLTRNSDKSSNVENVKRKLCSYHHSNGHLNEDCYQQQSESANHDNKKRWCKYHKSGSHSDDDCYHQRNSKRNSTVDSNSTSRCDVDSTVTGCDKKQCSCNSKVENKCIEIDTLPGIGFSFTASHMPLSQQTDGFQLLVDSGLSKHCIGPELIGGVESRMFDKTKIEPLTEIRAGGDNVLRRITQGSLLVVVRGTDDVLREVKLPIVLSALF